MGDACVPTSFTKKFFQVAWKESEVSNWWNHPHIFSRCTFCDERVLLKHFMSALVSVLEKAHRDSWFEALTNHKESLTAPSRSDEASEDGRENPSSLNRSSTACTSNSRGSVKLKKEYSPRLNVAIYIPLIPLTASRRVCLSSSFSHTICHRSGCYSN